MFGSMDAPPATRPATSSRALALLLLVTGAVIGIGGADEFRYFGPSTPQFWAGVCAVPAGAAAVHAAWRLWRDGPAARGAVRAGALALLAACAAGAALRVMGPPPLLLGALTAGAALWWASRGARHAGSITR